MLYVVANNNINVVEANNNIKLVWAQADGDSILQGDHDRSNNGIFTSCKQFLYHLINMSI